jgi:hypothetical protein
MTIGNTLLGLLTLVIPLLLIGIIALRRLPWILAFFVALVAVGAGYLHTTGGLKDIGRQVRTYVPAGILAERKAPAPEATAPASPPDEAPAMAPATPPAEAPAMAPATPAHEPTPAPAAAPPSPPPAPAPTPAPANP